MDSKFIGDFILDNIVIIGGRGFIGTNLLSELVSDKTFKNIALRCIDKVDDAHGISPVTGVEYITQDITSPDAVLNLSKIINSSSVVVHLAAEGSVVDSIDHPLNNFNSNVYGTLQVLESCRISQPSRLIFASTGGALMGNTAPPVSESSLPSPISPYGASKAAAESYIKAYSETYNIPSTILRFGNIYGPYSGHKKGVINKFFRNYLNGEDLQVFGAKSSRDMLYVKDLCEGIKKCIFFKSIKYCEIMHLASGYPTKIVDLARLLIVTMNALGKVSNAEIKIFPSRKGEVVETFATTKVAKKNIAFNPETKLRDGLFQTLQHLLNNEK